MKPNRLLLSYTTFGFSIGLIFPLIAGLLWAQSTHATFIEIFTTKSNVLIFTISLAPLILAFTTFLIGKHINRLEAANQLYKKQLVKATEDLQFKNTELEAMFSAFPDILFQLSSDGIIIDFRTANKEQLLIPPEKFLGQKIQEVYSEDVGKLFLDAIHSVNKTGETVITRYQLELPGDQQASHFEARLVPLCGGGFLSIIRDISDLKEAELKLLESQASIERHKGMDNLIATYHHELNNPLSVGLGLTQILLKEDSTNIRLKKVETSLITVRDVVRKIGSIKANSHDSVETKNYSKGRDMVSINRISKDLIAYKKNLKILVIDDNQDMLALFLDQLHMDGFQSTNAAHSLQEAYDLLETEEYDIALCDCSLANGHDNLLSNRFKSLSKQTPLILLSTASQISQEELKKYGAVSFLSKPLGITTVEREILDILPSPAAA